MRSCSAPDRDPVRHPCGYRVDSGRDPVGRLRDGAAPRSSSPRRPSLAYRPVFRAGFVWDDHVLIAGVAAAPRSALAGSGSARTHTDYWPLTWTTFWLEWHLRGATRRRSTPSTSALHIVASLLLWRLLRSLRHPGCGGRRSPLRGPPGGGRVGGLDLGAQERALGGLLLRSLLAWTRFDEDGRRRDGVASFLLYLLALLAKTSVVMLPFVQLGIALWRRGTITRRDLARTAPFFVLSAGFALLTIWFQGAHVVRGEIAKRGIAERIGGAGWALLSYVQKAFVPVDLALVRPRWPAESRSVAWWVPSLVVLAVAVAAVVLGERAWARPVAFALGYHALMVLPVLGFLDMAYFAVAPVSNHLQYLALAAPCALAGAGLASLRARLPAVAVGLGAATAVALGTWTFHRSAAFESELRLWTEAVRDAPESFYAALSLAQELGANVNMGEAVGALRAFEARSPDEADRRLARAHALVYLRRPTDAAAEAVAADALRPDVQRRDRARALPRDCGPLAGSRRLPRRPRGALPGVGRPPLLAGSRPLASGQAGGSPEGRGRRTALLAEGSEAPGSREALPEPGRRQARPGERRAMSPLPPPPASEVLRRSLPALLLASIVLVPFLGKPFTMDDTVFLFEARHALTDPLHPTAFEMPWNGAVGRVSSMVPTGPGMAWLLVPAVLSSHPEVVAHLLQLAMLWLAIVATVALALRLGVPSRWSSAAGLLVGLAPAVLGMAGTAMPDVPAMALGTAGIQQLVAWREDRRVRQAVLAAILLGLAPLVRTHAVGLWVVGVLLLAGDVLASRRFHARPLERWIPLVAAPFLTAAITLLARDPAPMAGSISAAAAHFSDARNIGTNLLAFLASWALALPLALPWAAVHWRRVLGSPLPLVLSMAAAAALVRFTHPVNTPWFVAPIAGLSAAVITDVFADGWRRRDSTRIVLGLWLLLPLPAIAYAHLPAKLLLACAPAAAILVVQALSSTPALGRPVLAATVLASCLLGVAILSADAVFAGLGRDAARTFIAPEVARGRRVYFTGSWGFHWYAAEAGAVFFPVQPPFPRNGDLVVACRNCEPHLLPDEMRALVPVRRVVHADPGGRVMDPASGSGFFSNRWGYLPWSWGSGVHDAFDVYVVQHPK